MLTPHQLKNTLKGLIPDSVLMHRLPTGADNTILLTFDDGPNETLTPIILEQLNKFNVRALFFVIGEKVEQLPHIVKMISQQGHILGNHTFSHSYQRIPSWKEYAGDIQRCQNIIKDNIGNRAVLYRPPAGTISASGLILAGRYRLRTLLWSIEGGEWGVNKNDSAQTIGLRLKENLQPRDIVLLHDNNDKTPTILDIILPYLKKRKINLQKGVDFLCP